MKCICTLNSGMWNAEPTKTEMLRKMGGQLLPKNLIYQVMRRTKNLEAIAVYLVLTLLLKQYKLLQRV